MRFRIILIILVLTMTQCSMVYFYHFFGAESEYFTEKEYEVLNKTTKALGLGYGYDDRIKLNFIYKGTVDESSNMGKFSGVLAEIDNKGLISFYEKIFKLRYHTELARDRYRNRGKWQNYTYIQKHLLPPLNEYFAALERAVIAREPSYGANIVTRQQKLRKDVEDRFSRIRKRDNLIKRNKKLKSRK